MDLLQEYKELYYHEVEFYNRLRGKLNTDFAFLSVLGGILATLWYWYIEHHTAWYMTVYFLLCASSTILFIISCILFIDTYAMKESISLFPVEEIAKENKRILNAVSDEYYENAMILLRKNMRDKFIENAICNQKLNILKNRKHNKLMVSIITTFLISLITFTMHLFILGYETKTTTEAPQHIYIEGGTLDVQ